MPREDDRRKRRPSQSRSRSRDKKDRKDRKKRRSHSRERERRHSSRNDERDRDRVRSSRSHKDSSDRSSRDSNNSSLSQSSSRAKHDDVVLSAAVVSSNEDEVAKRRERVKAWQLARIASTSSISPTPNYSPCDPEITLPSTVEEVKTFKESIVGNSEAKFSADGNISVGISDGSSLDNKEEDISQRSEVTDSTNDVTDFQPMALSSSDSSPSLINTSIKSQPSVGLGISFNAGAGLEQKLKKSKKNVFSGGIATGSNDGVRPSKEVVDCGSSTGSSSCSSSGSGAQSTRPPLPQPVLPPTSAFEPKVSFDASVSVGVDSDVDPLDSFMTDLLSSGDVERQRGAKLRLPGASNHPPQHASLFGNIAKSDTSAASAAGASTASAVISKGNEFIGGEKVGLIRKSASLTLLHNTATELSQLMQQEPSPIDGLAVQTIIPTLSPAPAIVGSDSSGSTDMEVDGEPEEPLIYTNTMTAITNAGEMFDELGSNNCITLDQILGQAAGEAGDDIGQGGVDGVGGLGLQAAASGWESDCTVLGEESDEEIESIKEQQERLEFMTAMRQKFLADEERHKQQVFLMAQAATAGVTAGNEGPSSDQTAGSTDEKSTEVKDLKTGKVKREVLGRVFQSEGDVIDEMEVYKKKKTALELLDEAKRGKELKPIDHSTITYMPFRKNLYIVPKALSKLSVKELSDIREDLSVRVRGKGCPAPVHTWTQCGLSERALNVIQKHNLLAPFPIQQQAIPAIMCGRDVIGVAKTGSGKTLAFLLPMLRHVLDQPPLADGEGPVGIIMVPARELAFQITNEAKKFSKALGIRVTCIYGGAGVAEQIADLKRGAEIVVCTPGRMIDILCMQAGKMVSLRRVTMVVMDEADRMFDMGFEPQIKMIIQNTRPDRQTVLFSATFPQLIEKLARTVLKLPLEIVVGDRTSVNKDITQYVEVHDEEDKFMRLLQLLGHWYDRGSVLIFVDKQDKCDSLFADLLKSGYPCLSLHGGKDQLDRDHTLYEFKQGIKTVMVATSVAGRGLDVPDIVCVINYYCPNHFEDYIHRVGRTGRAGRKGSAYTFISPQEDANAHVLIKVLEKTHQTIPIELNSLNDGFKEKVARGDAQWNSGGFVGNKGFSFDVNEQNESQKLASMQRKEYEIEQGLGDKELEEDIVPSHEFFAAGAGGIVIEEDDVPVPTSSSSTAAPLVSATAVISADMTPLQRAQALAASLTLNNKQTLTGSLTTPSSGSSAPIDGQTALAKAKLIAQQMSNTRNLGPIGSDGLAIVNELRFSEELEINDYPPQARKKATQRSSLDEVEETSSVQIIARGSYQPPGKKESDERKLFLLIQGPTEMQVKQARMEILRLLDEETLRIGAGVAAAAGGGGRYSVL